MQSAEIFIRNHNDPKSRARATEWLWAINPLFVFAQKAAAF